MSRLISYPYLLSFLAFLFLIASCVKDKATLRPPPPPAPNIPVDYRDQFLGKYSGTYTFYSFSQGTTTSTSYLNIIDSISKISWSDSLINSRIYGDFTLSAQGTATAVLGWLISKGIRFRNDSVLIWYSDFSALGGKVWENYEGKK